VLSAKGNASFFGFGPKGAAKMDFSGRERKKCFLNDHGKGMVDISYWAGIDSAQDGRAIAQADLDHDGSPELLVAMRDRPMFHVWRRRSAETRGHVLGLDVRSTQSPNTTAIGAQVTASCAGHKITRVVAAGSGFATEDAHTLTIGTGECEKLDTLVVRWPSKLEKTFQDVKTNELYTVDEDKLHNVGGFYRARAATQASAAPAASPGKGFADALARATAHDASGAHSWSPSHDVVYVDLWASWCEACKRNQPVVDALSKRYAARMDFVGVSMDPADGESVVADHAKTTAYPLLASSDAKSLVGAAAPLVGEKPALPSTLLLERSTGKVLWKGTGVPSVSDVEAALGSR